MTEISMRRNLPALPRALLVLILSVSSTYADTATTVSISQNITVYQTNMGFRRPAMMCTKLIAQTSYQRIGVLTGDIVIFEALHTPAVTLSNSEYSWSGEQSGTGKTENVTFNTAGARSESVTVGGKTKTATITVKDLPPPDLATYCVTHAADCITVGLDGNEARNWSLANQTNLGGGYVNGPTDAARHSYWNAIIVIDGISQSNALAATTAYERSDINVHPHNEIVMDLENNADGAAMGTALGGGASRAAAEAAVRAALAAGTLTKIDDYANQQERGLLQPSNLPAPQQSCQ